MIAKRLDELARRADQRGEIVYTRFLDPAEAVLAHQAARKAAVPVVFEGGYADAERRMAAFLPDWEACPEWPMECVELAWDPRYSGVRHKDLLGASLAVVQDRSCFGDIVLDQDHAYLYVIRDLAELVLQDFRSAGRTPLQASIKWPWPLPPLEEERTRRDTVASLRLDSMVASAFQVSRGQAQTSIRQGLVKVNHLPTTSTDALVRPGDLLSLRGHGRGRFVQEEGDTRKGRVAVLWSYKK